MDRINACKLAGNSHFSSTVEGKYSDTSSLKSQFNRPGSNSDPEGTSPADTLVTSRTTALGSESEPGTLVRKKREASKRNKKNGTDLLRTAVKGAVLETPRKFASEMVKKTVGKLLAIAWPSKLTGIKVAREELKAVDSEIKAHKKKLERLQKKIETEEKRKIKGKGEAGAVEKLAREQLELKEGLYSLSKTREELADELAAIESSMKTVQNGIADLATNLRNLYHRPSDTPLEISLQHLPVGKGKGNFLLEDVKLVPEKIHISKNKGKDTITLVASVPRASLSIPVEGAENINCQVKLKALALTLDGKMATSLARYVKAQNPFEALNELQSLLSGSIGIIQKKKEGGLFAHQTSEKKESVGNALPSELSIHADEVDIQLASLNAAQAAGLNKMRRQPSGTPEILNRLLQLPVNATVDSIHVQTQGLSTASPDDQIQMDLAIKEGRLTMKPDSGVKYDKKVSSSISASAKTLSVDVKHPLKASRALKKELDILIPAIAGEAVTASLSGGAELIGAASITSTDVKAEGVVNLKTDAPDVSLQELKPGEWLGKLDATARVTASDLTFRGKGSVNLTGNLKQLEVDHHYAAGSQKTGITFGANKGKDSLSSLSCRGGQVQDGGAPLLFKGAVDLKMEGRAVASLEKKTTTESKTETILAVEKLPEIKVETKETVEVSTNQHSLSLPAGMNISVDALAFKQSSTGEHTAEKVTEVSHGKIKCEGNGEVRYRGRNSDGSPIDKGFQVAGAAASKSARFIYKEQGVSGQRFAQVKTDDGGITLEKLKLPGGRLKKIDIAVDKELNGTVSVEGLSLDFNTLLSNKLLPREIRKKIPWYAKLLLKNKQLNIDAKFSVRSGNVSINDRSGIKASFKAEKGSGMMNTLTTLIANNVLRLGSFFEKHGQFNLHSDGRQLMVSSSLRRGRNYALHSEKADKFVQATGMDASGNINISNALHAYTGVMLLPESKTGRLDSIGAQALGGDEASTIELINQAEALLSDPATRSPGIYALQQIPWSAVLQQAIPESGELHQKLLALAELAMAQDETCVSGIMLARKLNTRPEGDQKLNIRLAGDKAQQLFNRCIRLKQDLLPLGDLLSETSDAATKRLAFKCYEIAARRSPDSGKAHYKCAQMLIPADDGVVLAEQEQEIIVHLEKAACLNEKAAYSKLSDMAKTSEYADLALARVHLFSDAHSLTPVIVEDSGTEPSWQDNFNRMYAGLLVLSQSKNSDIARQAQSLLASRCIESAKITHPWAQSHYKTWDALMEKARDKAVGKKAGKSPFTDSQCVDIAKTCLYALNGQPQDLVLAKAMLDTLKVKTTEAQLLLKIIDTVKRSSN